MFKPRKAEQLGHERQAKASIMDSFAGRFKRVFRMAKKVVQKREIILDQRDHHTQQSGPNANESLLGQHRNAQDRLEGRIMPLLPEYRLPAFTVSDLALEFDSLSAAEQSQYDGHISGEQARPERSGPEEKTENLHTLSNSANEATIHGRGDHEDITTKFTRFPQQGLQPDHETSDSATAAPEGQPDELAKQSIATSDRERIPDSELDDDADVANYLLSPSESDLRASNWNDEDNEDPAALNARSLMRRTGIDEVAAQDLYEELQAVQQQVVLADQVDIIEPARANRSIKSVRYGGSVSSVRLHLQNACVGTDAEECSNKNHFGPSEPQTSSISLERPPEQRSRSWKASRLNEQPDISTSLDHPTKFQKAHLANIPAVGISEGDEVLSKNNGCRSESSKAYSRWSANNEEHRPTGRPQIAESEESYAESDGGAPVNDSEQRSETPRSDTCLVASRTRESEAEPSSPAAIATAGKCLAHNERLPFSDLYVMKRFQRRSAPGAFDLSHDRSSSETTLVDSRPATPSPLESKFPPLRPLGPIYIAGRRHQPEEGERVLAVEQAVKEAIEATNREWESANAATEFRHENEIEELKEDQQAAIRDLQEKHQEDLKKVRKKHGDKMKDVRGEVARARSEKKAVERTLENMMTEGDALREELRAKDEQLERAIAAAQALQAYSFVHNHGQDVRSEPIVAMWSQPIHHDSFVGPASAPDDRLEEQAIQFNTIIAQLQDDLAQCQQTRDWYMERSERYHKAMVDTAERKSVTELEEQLRVLKIRLHECEMALNDEQRIRKAESEMFSNQVMIMRESMRRCELDAKAMDLSRKAALAANEANIRMMRRPVTDNEIDIAIWEQYRIIQRDCQELRQNAEGHEHQKLEKAEEINALKEKVLKLELQGPRDKEGIRRLEEEISRLKFDYDTAIHERDIAVQDQEKREPELWKLIRDKPLRERDEKIAHLEAQLHDRVMEEDRPDPGTPFSIAKATNNHGLATPAQGSTPGPLFGYEEATVPEDFSTPSHGSSPSPLFSTKQVTQPEVFPTPNGSPKSDQADISFF